MGTVSFEVPGPGTYQVTCDPKLDPLDNAGGAGDVLAGKQFYNDQNQVVTGTLVPGSDTGDATATAGDILAPKTAYVAAGKVTGTIATKSASDVTADGPLVAVPPGYYPQAVNKSVSDPDLVPGNIKAGVEIFGVTGTFAGGLPQGVRTITLTADPPEGGTVSGGGVASDGMMLTVSAAPNEADNYYFDSWKENDTVVSTEPLYQFSITADRSLIAAFLQSQYAPGVDWWEMRFPSSATWYSVAYGGGKFVAVASGSKAAYSEDGINWTAATLPSSATWYSVAYGGGKFVAVASGSEAAYSEDGINWTAATLPSSATWYSVAYGGGKFVAVASGSKAAYSEDGINWTAATLPSSRYWESVTYGNGKFVALHRDTNNQLAIYSEDGINWDYITLPFSGIWKGVTYGNGKFVAVAMNSSEAAYSEDGINWTAATLPSSATWYSVAYGGGKFVAVANSSNKAAYSIDGINWAAATLPSSTYWYSVAYGNGKFVAVINTNTDKAAYSSAKGPGA